MNRPPNIGLQRTARRLRAAAEAASFGGRMKGAALILVALTCCGSSGLAHGQAGFDQDVWGPTVVATVSLQHGFCLECPSWLIAFLPDRSALVVVRDSNALSAPANRYRITRDNPMLPSLLALVQDLDPATRSGFLLDSETLVVRCNPPGSLFIEKTLPPADVATPLGRIRDLAERLVRDAKTGTLYGGS